MSAVQRNFDWLPAYLDEALQYRRVRQGNQTTATLQAHLLKALELSAAAEFAEAESIFCEAFEQARISDSLEIESISCSADLAFAYGRMLGSMGRVHDGLDFVYLALRVYTRLYGVKDGRAQFCASRHKELALSVNDKAGYLKIQFLLRAHDVLAILWEMELLHESNYDQQLVQIEYVVTEYEKALRARNIRTFDSDTAILEDGFIAELILQLKRASIDTELLNSKLLVFVSLQTDVFIETFPAHYLQYVQAFNDVLPAPVLKAVRCAVEKTKSAESLPTAYLYFLKSADVNGSNTRPFKWQCKSLDDICILFNRRLKKIGSKNRFYKIDAKTLESDLYFVHSEGSDAHTSTIPFVVPGGNGPIDWSDLSPA